MGKCTEALKQISSHSLGLKPSHRGHGLLAVVVAGFGLGAVWVEGEGHGAVGVKRLGAAEAE